MTVPANLKYTAEHEWVLIDQHTATVGITAYATDALGDVVYLQLPSPGAAVSAGEICGEIESTKSVSDLYSPADGRVVEVNEHVVQDPGLLNSDPYGAGWLFRMELAGDPPLLDAATYVALTEGA